MRGARRSRSWPTCAVPRSGAHEADGVAVGTVTRAGAEPELNAATYSRWAAASIRLTTRTSCCAARTIVAPVESAGLASRSAASSRSCVSIGSSVTANDEPPPIGGEPTRGAVFHSGTCVGNMSCRACLSPPEPIIPTSSP